MTVSQMHIEFKLWVDKSDSFNSANFAIEEIDVYLSDAQEQFIELRAYGNNTKRESVEETQKRVKDLQSITENANVTTFINNSNNKPNGTFVQLPTDYRHALNEEISVQYLDCNSATQTARVPVIALTHDKYNRVVQNPFTIPSLNKAYRLPFGRISGKEHFEIIISEDQTLQTYYLRYLKNPTKIDKAQILTPPGLAGSDQGDMTDESYREIIRLAAYNAMSDIGSPLAQQAAENLKILE